MAELGEGGAAAHTEIGRLAARLGVPRLVAIGSGGAPEAYRAGYAEGGKGMVVPDVPAALEILRDELAPGDVVLVKASRSAGLERVAEGLLTDTAREARR
jgi:UDP-N-acetylmuramoyl-tripeptide--D-alanyl-D-alanine ligase